MKSSAGGINSQISNNIAQTMQTALEFFTKLCMLPSSENFKICSKKGLNVPLNWNNFSVMLLRLHKKEIILYTFRYVQVLIRDFFSWGRYLIKLSKSWYQVTNFVQSAIIAFLAGETFSTINQILLNNVLLNTCSQTQKLNSNGADCCSE